MSDPITHAPHPHPLPTGARELFGSLIALLIALLLLAAQALWGQTTVQLGAGLNLIALPHGTTITNSSEVTDLTNSPFIARTVTRLNGSTRFDAYIPGLTPPFPVHPDTGYIVSCPRMQTVTFPTQTTTQAMGVLVMLKGNTISSFRPTGELIGHTQVNNAPSNLYEFGGIGTDGNSLFAIEITNLDTGSLVQYDPRTNTRVVLAGPDRLSNLYMNPDGSILYQRKVVNTQYIHHIKNGVDTQLVRITPPFVAKAPYQLRGDNLFITMVQETASTFDVKLSQYQIWRVKLLEAGPQFVRLTAQPKGVAWFNISRDGKRVVYTPVRGNTEPAAVWTTEASGIGCEVKITPDASDEQIPVFTADGTHVLFRRIKNNVTTLHLLNLADVLEVTPVPIAGQFIGHPQFLSP